MFRLIHQRSGCRTGDQIRSVLLPERRRAQAPPPDGWIESRRPGSHRVLAEGDQQRTWAYHDGGPAMARIARDCGYTLAELRKL